MRTLIILVAIISVVLATTPEEAPAGLPTAIEVSKEPLKDVTFNDMCLNVNPLERASEKPHVQSCTCWGCTSTMSVGALSTTNIYLQTPCSGTSKAQARNVYVQSTDGSSFDLCTRDTSSSTSCYTAASATGVTCFEMSSAYYVQSAYNQIYVSVSCNNWLSSCAIKYSVTFSCSSTTTYSWSTGSWSTCSATCGGGTQTRTVTCKDSNGNTVADSYCTTTKPATSQACNTQPCSTYSWNTGSWSTCSISCGGGYQTRTVACRDSTGSTVADSYCTSSKPATSQTCNVQQCASNYQVTGRIWRYTPTCTANVNVCECTCCIGTPCTSSVAGLISVSSTSACNADLCTSNFPTKCPASGQSGIRMAYGTNTYSVTPGASADTCYASSDSSYDVSCTSTGYTYHKYTGTTCAATQSVKNITGLNGDCNEVDALTSVALTCKLNAAMSVHVAWASLLTIMLFGALLAVL